MCEIKIKKSKKMNRFDKFIPIIFKNEGFGKTTNTIGDAGGLTKYGISQKAHPDVDIKNLTETQAQHIYYNDYYLHCKIDSINNDLLAIHMFDMAVNSGTNRAVKILQAVVNAEQDGVIGAKTLSLVNGYDYSQQYINARIAYYNHIGSGSNAKFLQGWLNRVQNTTNSL
jgi:lysozyme family protein